MNDAGAEIHVHARKSLPTVSLQILHRSQPAYRRSPMIRVGVGEADRMFNLFLTDASDDTLTRLANNLSSVAHDLRDFIKDKSREGDDRERDD